MKPNFQLIFTFPLIIFILHCRNSNTYKESISSQSEIYVSLENPFSKNLTDFIKIKNIKQLHSNDKLSIPKFNKCLIHEDIIYALSSSKSIFTFTTNGILLSEFSMQGKGFGEYSILTDFDVFNDNIYIYDFNLQSLFIYDLSFNFKEKINIGYNFSKFLVTNDYFYLFTNKHRNKIDNKFIDYDILILDNNFRIHDTLLPFNFSLFSKIRISKERVFHKSNKRITFNDMISDSVYQVAPLFKKLNFFNYKNNRGLDKNYVNGSHQNILNDLQTEKENFIDKEYFSRINCSFNESDKKLLYEFLSNNKSIYSIYNSKNNKSINYILPDSLTTNRDFSSIFDIKFSIGNKKYSLIYPYVLEFIKKEIKSSKLSLSEKNSILTKINPILNNSQPDGNYVLIEFEL